MAKKGPIHITHLHATRYNVGDDAIVMATHSLVQSELADREVRFFDLARDEFAREGEPIADFLPLYECHRPRNWPRLLRFLLSSNAVMIGGGELICGGLEYLGIAALAKLIRRPVVFYGVGVDIRHASRFAQRYTRRVLAMADRIVVRDQGAYAELEALGVDMGKAVSAADIVLALEPVAQTEPAALPLPPSPGAGITIGVSLRSQITGGRQFGDAELTSFVAALDHVIEAHDANVVFFPFLGDDSPYEQTLAGDEFATDTRIMRRCLELMRRPERAVIYEGDCNPHTLMGLFSRLDVMVAMRLHASILAVNAGLRPIGLNYSRKIERVLGTLGLSDVLVDLHDLTGPTLDARIRTILSGRMREPSPERLVELRGRARWNVSKLVHLLGAPRSAWTPVLAPLLLAGLVAHWGLLTYVESKNPLLLKALSLRKRWHRRELASA